MNSSNPNDKNNLFVGTGYTLKINRKDGEVVDATVKKLFGQKPMITTSGLGTSTNVIISTPIVTPIKKQTTQTETKYTHSMSDKEMIEQSQNGIICPTCNGTVCPVGNSNMCY